VKKYVAVEGPKVAVVFCPSGREGLSGTGNPGLCLFSMFMYLLPIQFCPVAGGGRS
jgi:hypothetical protein